MEIEGKGCNDRDWKLSDGIWLYRQRGGCLEIGQNNDDERQPADLVHVCFGDVDDFVRLLKEFRDETEEKCNG